MHRLRTIAHTVRTWWKRQRTLAKTGMIVGALIVLLIILGKGAGTETMIETAMRQDLARTVAASGTVVSTVDLSLSFQQSNLVRTINVAVGDKVSKGQILATLANANQAAAVQSARGTYLAAQARYNKVLEGESNEVVRQAEIALENARRKLFSDSLVALPLSVGQTSVAPIISGSFNGTVPGKYRVAFRNTQLIDFTYIGLEKGTGDVDDVSKPFGTKGLMIRFPGDTYAFSDEWEVTIPNKDGQNYVVNLNAYNASESDLAIKKAGARSVDIEAARAELLSAEGSLANAQAELEKTVIRAPSSGTITKINLKLGELAETFEPVITLQDVGNLYVEANINESSISNIAFGQPVSITYDAFGKEKVFLSTIDSIDLGATVVDNIVNYKIKALIPDPDGIRSGMTANLSIQTAFAPDVIVVPERVVTETDGKTTVEVLVDERRGTTRTQAVTLGLRGDGGLVEIASGLSEGERVVFTAR